MLNYSIAPNTGVARTATITIAGKAVSISQATVLPPTAPSGFRVVTGGSQP
jgi:hypothetical protein